MKVHKTVAVIGLGNISSVHIEALQKCDVEIKYLCDINEQKFKKFEYIKNALFTKDYKEIKNVDSVHVCTNHFAHYEITKYFLEMNVDVFCEKIATIDFDSASNLCTIAKNTDTRLSICYQNRYNPNITCIKNILDDKRYGNLKELYVEVVWNRPNLYYENNWQGKKKIAGGGVLATQASHTVDLLTYLFNDFQIEDVDFMYRKNIEIETTIQLKVKFGEIPCLLYATVDCPFDNEVRIIYNFENMQIVLDGNNLYKKEDGKIEMISYEGEKSSEKKLSWGGYHHKAIQEYHNGNDLLAIETTLLTDKLLEEVYKLEN